MGGALYLSQSSRIGSTPVRRKPAAIEFRQKLSDPSTGYAYDYRKSVSMASEKPQTYENHARYVLAYHGVAFGIFVLNLVKGNHAPFPYTFFGFPVKGDAIEHTYGFVMEEFSEKEGTLMRRWIPVHTALSQMVTAKRVYTKDLKRYPEKYRKELALYRKAGMVWISYGVPFILPILAGFATALFGGDILFAALRAMAGG